MGEKDWSNVARAAAKSLESLGGTAPDVVKPSESVTLDLPPVPPALRVDSGNAGVAALAKAIAQGGARAKPVAPRFLPTLFNAQTLGGLPPEAASVLREPEGDYRPLERLFDTKGRPLGDLAEMQRRVSAAGKDWPQEHAWMLDANAIPYLIVVNSGTTKVVTIDQQAQDKIEAALRDQSPLNERETSLAVQIGEDAVRELRGLRKATEIFERATPLQHDIGGWAGNIPANLGVGFQQVCGDEGRTFQHFVEQLRSQGLVRWFTPDLATRHTFVLDAHAATLLRHVATDQSFVLDGWHEDGGTAAHISRLADWMAKKDKVDVVSLLPDAPAPK